MPTPLRLQLPTDDPDNILAPYLQSYRGHFSARRYGPKHLRRYVAIVIHFGRWLQAEGLRADQLDGTIVSRFLVDHLPRCTCQRPVQRDVIGNRAALNHLVQLLRALAVAAVRADDEITRELASFDAKMAEVWGLSQGTRDHRYRIVRRLLRGRFGSGPISIQALSPAHIRDFVLGDEGWSPSTIRVMSGAVRCYLQHRALGDDVRTLLRAIPRPAFWRETNLPDTLSPDELEQLIGAFRESCPSWRRGYAAYSDEAGRGFRFEAGRHSEAKPATGPI